MKRPVRYNTRQRSAILTYVQSLESRHVTAAEIAAHLQKTGTAIGRTTIYRHLDSLTAEGRLRRYTTDGAAACYQYQPPTPESKGCGEHFHLKCEDCGTLIHLECQDLHAVHRHISDHHSFAVNPGKTIFYGRCAPCGDKDR